MVNRSGIPLPQAIEDAFVFMEENQPKHPTELLNTLGAYQGTDWSNQNVPFFKGWVGQIDGRTRYDADMGLYPEDLSKITYIGMWVGRTKKQIIWCVLPSLNNGIALPGEVIETGDERIFPGQRTQDELDDMVIRGWGIMNDMITEYGKFGI